jgi:hypothetical protein
VRILDAERRSIDFGHRNDGLLLVGRFVTLMHADRVHHGEVSLAEISNKSNNNVSVKYIQQIKNKTNIRYRTLFDRQERSYMQILRVEFSSSVLLISGE